MDNQYEASYLQGGTEPAFTEPAEETAPSPASEELPHRAQIVTAARPLLDRSQRVVLRISRKIPGILWLFFAALLLYFLEIAPALAQALGFSAERVTATSGIVFTSLAVAVLWELLAKWYFGRIPQSPAAEIGRIEVYPEGVVFRSRTEQRVIPFDRVTALWETSDILLLRSDTEEIVWQGYDLTPYDANFLRHTLFLHLPDNTVFRKGMLIPRLSYPLAVPQLDLPAPMTAEAACRYDRRGSLGKAWGEVLLRAGGIFLFLSAVVACLLTNHFTWTVPLLQNVWFWGAALAFVGCPLFSLLLLALGRCSKKPAYRLGCSAEGVSLTDGMNEYRCPWNSFSVRKKGAGLCLTLPCGKVKLPAPKTDAERAVFAMLSGYIK